MAIRAKTEDPAGTAPDDASANDMSDRTLTDMDNQDSSLGSNIANSAKRAASQAKEAAGRAVDEAKNQAETRADHRRQTMASGFQAVADAFRSMGETLRRQEQGFVAHYAAEMGDAVGGQVERVANYLQGRDVHQLVGDAEDFARRSPALFLCGAFVLGFATSRFLKSSRPGSANPAGEI